MVALTPPTQLVRFGLLSSAGPAILELRAKATHLAPVISVLARNLMFTGFSLISCWYFAWDLYPVWRRVGFGTSGIVGGTIASKAQSMIGIVGAKSLFTVLQSAGMGGYGQPILADTVKTAGFAIAGLGAVLAVLSKTMEP